MTACENEVGEQKQREQERCVICIEVCTCSSLLGLMNGKKTPELSEQDSRAVLPVFVCVTLYFHFRR